MQMGDHRVLKRVADPGGAAWVSGWVRFVFATPKRQIQTTQTPRIKVRGRPEPPMAYPGHVKCATRAYSIVQPSTGHWTIVKTRLACSNQVRST
jgi:hypothetical protein